MEKELENETKRREGLEKTLQKQIENDKGRSKVKISELSIENEELKKTIKAKELMIFTLEEEWNTKIKEVKENYLSEKKMVMLDCEEKLR